MAHAINQIEWIRRQLYDLQTVLADTGDDKAPLIKASDVVDGTLIAVEEKLIQMKLTGNGQDGPRWPTMLSGRLRYLASTVAIYDFPQPTSSAKCRRSWKNSYRR